MLIERKILKVEHPVCKKFGIENIQNHLKCRIQQCINGVVNLHNDSIKSDSFPNYFIKYLKYLNRLTIKANDTKQLLNIRIVSKLNSISALKTFGTENY